MWPFKKQKQLNYPEILIFLTLIEVIDKAYLLKTKDEIVKMLQDESMKYYNKRYRE
jgi:hypothetical protein